MSGWNAGLNNYFEQVTHGEIPMNETAFYEAFASVNPFTGLLDGWIGTATLETIREHSLLADLSCPLYGDASLAVDGWGCKSALNRL